MKISSLNSSKVGAAPTKSSVGGEVKSERRDDNLGPAVKVSVSQRAMDLASATVSSDMRVEKLRAAIGSGTYRIDARAIAAAIVNGEG
jgi:flagellar biosynthesis anti-sigma factor FlgM